ncbi:MFS transporter [Pseudonocardia sp. RS010]|uniref:MFS transporter n=1 Tax=Pseudonocardia sp. RS010 TaxID=3385979 RepID=UPI0039A0E34C
MTDRLTKATRAAVATGSAGRAWLITAVLFVFMLLNWADKAVLGLAATPIMKEMGLSASEFGLASSAVFFLFGISALFTGTLADRVGTNRLLLVMAVIWSIAMLPALLLPSLGFLIVGRTLLGAAEGPASPVASLATMKWFPAERRNLPVSIVVSGALLGLAIAAPTLSWVIANWGWKWSFALLAILGVVWAVVWRIVGKEGPYLGADEHGQQPEVSGSAAAERPTVSAWRIVGSRTWLTFTFALFAAYWTSALLMTWIPSFLTTQMGFSTVTAGNLTGISAFFCAVAMLVQGFLGNRLMSRGRSSRLALGVISSVAVLASGLAMVGFVLLPGNGPVRIVLLVIAFSLSNAVGSSAPNAIGYIIPAGKHGFGLGAYIAIGTSAGVVAPALTGVLLDAAASPTAGYTIGFAVAAGLLLVSGVALLIGGNPDRDRVRLASTQPAVSAAA